MSWWNKMKHIIKTNDSTPVDSFEMLNFRTSAMRSSEEYEILLKDDKAEVSFYNYRIVDGDYKRVLEKQVICDKEKVLKLLNDCKILAWDGFRGDHPKGVSDGTMFTLKAVVNDQKIYADGSENFPKYYREFNNGLRELLEAEGL
ncbi:MAG: hypothetical protein IK151_01310 [Erysipelotrichaceae bacterium]|nr:hypothetical protein [Erysipelotrichaceae bacterium]